MMDVDLRHSYDYSGAACVGQWELFDSLDADDTWRARQLCATCPHRPACSLLAADQPNRTIEGTWAGNTYKNGQPLTERGAA